MWIHYLERGLLRLHAESREGIGRIHTVEGCAVRAEKSLLWGSLPAGLVGSTALGLLSVAIFGTLEARGQEPAAAQAEALAIAPARPLTAPEITRRDRLRKSVEWLAAPEREGRGPGTKGIDVAAEWVAEQFVALGLDTSVVGETSYQPFSITLDAKLGAEAENVAEIVSPPGADGASEVRQLVLGTDWTPLAAGGSGAFDLPLAFAGYGITAKAEDYDDYSPFGAAGAKGAAVIVLRQEPQKDDPKSKFDGNQASQYAALSRKVANASEHEVGAVVFCNDASNTDDALMAFNRAGDGSDKRTLPVVQLKRPVVDAILEKALGKTLPDLEKGIDDGPTPRSAGLDGWRIRGRVAIERSETQARNILAVLPGIGATVPPSVAADAAAMAAAHGAAAPASPHDDPPASPAEANALETLEKKAAEEAAKADATARDVAKAAEPTSPPAGDPHAGIDPHAAPDPHGGSAAHGSAAPQPILPAETVIVGAHYDHLGYGGSNSAAPGDATIHHGADDNGSGTAMLVEVARILAEEGPYPRSILFVAFSGEERGLLGSAHYTANAAVPLTDTVAMVNLDMVGRYDGGKLIIHGTGTGTGLDAMVDRLVATHGFDVTKDPGGFGPSDHASFYAKKIPVLHVFTGTHSDYHRPTDTAEKINYDGMTRIARMVAEGVKELARAPQAPAYVEVAGSQTMARRDGERPYFGSIPDFGKPGKGYAISGVSKDSPAAKGGLLGGDLIIRIGESAVTGLDDFDSALRKHKGGDTVPVVVKRGEAEVTLDVTLGAPR
jgi:Zn-dependent M28 family amino/carboxypeptidase